jgi:hypothetical protein
MTFEDGCVVAHLKPDAWYVCVPPIAAGNEYHAVTRPLSRAAAFKVCRELNTLEELDWSDLTRQAVLQTPPAHRI